MIKTEKVTVVDTEYNMTYSDKEVLIKQEQDGQFYDVAFDEIGHEKTYTETTIPIPAGWAETEEEEEENGESEVNSDDE